MISIHILTFKTIFPRKAKFKVKLLTGIRQSSATLSSTDYWQLKIFTVNLSSELLSKDDFKFIRERKPGNCQTGIFNFVYCYKGNCKFNSVYLYILHKRLYLILSCHE